MAVEPYVPSSPTYCTDTPLIGITAGNVDWDLVDGTLSAHVAEEYAQRCRVCSEPNLNPSATWNMCCASCHEYALLERKLLLETKRIVCPVNAHGADAQIDISIGDAQADGTRLAGPVALCTFSKPGVCIVCSDAHALNAHEVCINCTLWVVRKAVPPPCGPAPKCGGDIK